MRVGVGYDVHRLVCGRKLIIGGVCIPYEKGLLGHSDADVLVHSIIDALLGAMCAGDIGQLFPDSDERFKGACSLDLLRRVGGLLNEYGYILGNIDSVLVAEQPKISPYLARMKENIAGALNACVSQISVKATTEEGLGFTGQGQGIAAHAVAVIVFK